MSYGYVGGFMYITSGATSPVHVVMNYTTFKDNTVRGRSSSTTTTTRSLGRVTSRRGPARAAARYLPHKDGPWVYGWEQLRRRHYPRLRRHDS